MSTGSLQACNTASVAMLPYGISMVLGLNNN